MIDVKGRDARSAGNASALVTAVPTPDGDQTSVSVDTDLKISGKPAQFGSGMIKEVSAKLLAQFVANLDEKPAADAAGTTTPPASASPEPAQAPPAAVAPETAPAAGPSAPLRATATANAATDDQAATARPDVARRA